MLSLFFAGGDIMKIRISRVLKSEIHRKMMVGQPLDWHWVRTYVNSNYKADEVCYFYCNYRGMQIRYQGKLHSVWSMP